MCLTSPQAVTAKTPPQSISTQSVPNSQLWTIHGARYDLREYVKKHPGGERAIMLGQGIDCTNLFETYHLFTDRPRKVLKAYMYHDCSAPDQVDDTFDWKSTPFFDEIKAAARNYFSPHGDESDEEVQRNSKASWASWLRHGVGMCLLMWAFCQYLRDAPWSVCYFPCLYWLVASDLMHNGSHYCMARVPWINTLSYYIGSFHIQVDCWDVQHVIGHHCFTNLVGKDPDLHHWTHQKKTLPGFRVHREQKYLSKYGMLWKCAIAFHFAMSTIGLAILWIPKWLNHRRLECVKLPERVVPAIKRDRALFGAACLAYVCTRESVFIGAYTLFLSFAIHGSLFMTFTGISHINEDCMDETEEYRKKQGLEKLEWARHQLLSGYDYGGDSQLMAIISINLSQQICHHMFPSVHPCHYPALRKIVTPIAAKYGLDYKARSSDSFLGAVTKALRWISQLNDASINMQVSK